MLVSWGAYVSQVVLTDKEQHCLPDAGSKFLRHSLMGMKAIQAPLHEGVFPERPLRLSCKAADKPPSHPEWAGPPFCSRWASRLAPDCTGQGFHVFSKGASCGMRTSPSRELRSGAREPPVAIRAGPDGVLGPWSERIMGPMVP